MAGWAMHLWNEWSIQILVLLSFTLQVFILLFAGMRQRNSRAWRLLLWLAYLLANTTALYTLGHISNSKLPELRPAAFWAQFLLLHLGGPDTMTAYALEDNQLWLRHLLTLVLQALGAGYMLYRHITGSGPLLVMAAVLIYLVGVMKYGERVWTLKSSSHDGITNLLDNVYLYQFIEELFAASVVNAEDVLRDAHELLYICMGQFVDYKVWPSVHQNVVITLYCRDITGRMLFKLIAMQLSLMHDIFYTKAVVIHTWFGCCNRTVSLVATVTALLLFTFNAGKDGYTRADVAFTYILLGGAIVLEMTSVLRAIGSSWTYVTFIDRDVLGFARRDGILYRLYRAIMFFRRLFKSAERGSMLSGSVGQHNLWDLFTMKQNFSSRIARIAGLEKWLNKLRITGTVDISDEYKRMMMQEMDRIVMECNGDEHRMWSYRGHRTLSRWAGYSGDPDVWCIEIDFDESVLAWHFATNLFLLANQGATGSSSSQQLQDAIKVLSNYMMFLLVEHPYMLPSPVRARHYDLAYSWLMRVVHHPPFVSRSGNNQEIKISLQHGQPGSPAVLVHGAKLATMLLNNRSEHLQEVIFGVWVEMLCYAASHCSRDSHARHLNCGAGLITIVWIIQTTLFNYRNHQTALFRRATDDFFDSRR